LSRGLSSINRKLLVIILILTIIITAFSGCVNENNNNNDSKNDKIFYKYFIKTGTYSSNLISEDNMSFNYEIIIPIILLENNSPSEINNLLEIKSGNPTFQIIKTIHGYGLYIKANGSIWLEFENENRYDIPIPDEEDNNLQNPKVKMSMIYNNLENSSNSEINYYFWIYYNGTNTKFSYNVYMNFDNSGNILKFNIDNDDLKIINGWNKYLSTYTPKGSYDD
jgi:hypothetical protein